MSNAGVVVQREDLGMNKFKSIFILLLFGQLGACAYPPHKVTLDAKALTDTAKVGNKAILALDVTDNRDGTVVGQRGGDMMGADITVEDLAQNVRHELKSGLEARGFVIVGVTQKADVELVARLRAFKIFFKSGAFYTGILKTNIAINIIAERGRRKYRKIYRHDNKKYVLVFPEGSEIDKKLNTGLNDVYRKIIYDDALMKFLAKP